MGNWSFQTSINLLYVAMKTQFLPHTEQSVCTLSPTLIMYLFIRCQPSSKDLYDTHYVDF
jgi:hypothetical protein